MGLFKSQGLKGIAVRFAVILIVSNIAALALMNAFNIGENFYAAFSYKQTEGVVKHISVTYERSYKPSRGNSPGHYRTLEKHSARIVYTDDSGTEHTTHLSPVSDAVTEGTRIKIYYDPRDPEKIVYFESKGSAIIVIVTYVLLNIASIVVIIILYKKDGEVSRPGKFSWYMTSADIESRFRSADEYGGELTERAKERIQNK